MSNIHKAGPDTESSELSVENEENKNESADIRGPESTNDPTQGGDTNPTIKNH